MNGELLDSIEVFPTGWKLILDVFTSPKPAELTPASMTNLVSIVGSKGETFLSINTLESDKPMISICTNFSTSNDDCYTTEQSTFGRIVLVQRYMDKKLNLRGLYFVSNRREIFSYNLPVTSTLFDIRIYGGHPEGQLSTGKILNYEFTRLPPYEYSADYGLNPGCNSGTYDDGNFCRKCPAKHKCPTRKMTAPLPCLMGRHQPKVMQTRCLACHDGKICQSGSITNCPFMSQCQHGAKQNMNRKFPYNSVGSAKQQFLQGRLFFTYVVGRIRTVGHEFFLYSAQRCIRIILRTSQNIEDFC